MKRIVIRFFMIQSSLYTFFSGVFMSISINIYTSLKISSLDFKSSTNFYLVAFAFFVISLLLMIISTKTGHIQNFFLENKVGKQYKSDTIDQIIKPFWWLWVSVFNVTILFVIFSVVLLSVT